MMVKREGLELETRQEIHNYILKNPGLCLNEISRKLKISKSTLNYHLNYLKKLGVIIAKSTNRYVRFYIVNKVGNGDKKIINIIRQDIPFKIIAYLLLNPNSSQIEISKFLKKHPTTIAFHLEKLANIDVVTGKPRGNEINYKIKNEEEIFGLLDKYKDSFFDDTVDYILSSLFK